MTSIKIRAAAEQAVIEVERYEPMMSFRGDEETVRALLCDAAAAAYAAIYPRRPRLVFTAAELEHEPA
jgi:hypothetical protein